LNKEHLIEDLRGLVSQSVIVAISRMSLLLRPREAWAMPGTLHTTA
jgi:hypothetical protein